MKRISTFLNLLGFLLLSMFPNTGICQEFRKANIQIYREMEGGDVVKKDTIISLEDLGKIGHLLGKKEKESLRTAIFLAEGRQTQIKSQRENGVKTISIGQYEGDDWENLDPETKKKVIEAFEIANIPKMQAGKESQIANQEQYAELQESKVEWDGESKSTTTLSGQNLQINRNDLTEGQERALLEALKNEEVYSLLEEMNVEISLEGKRPSPLPRKFYRLENLSADEEQIFRAKGLIGTLETLKIKHLSLKSTDDSYSLSVETSESSGEMSIIIKEVSGNVLLRDTHLSENGRYEKTITLGSSFGSFYFLTIAQNGKILHKRIFPTAEKLVDLNSP